MTSYVAPNVNVYICTDCKTRSVVESDKCKICGCECLTKEELNDLIDEDKQDITFEKNKDNDKEYNEPERVDEE